MTWRRAAGGAIVLAVLTLAVLGLVRAASPAGTATMRERVDEVAATLRCPTCQGLSIQDSTSVLADGSRRIIQQQLQQGRTPDQIRQWFVDRYGSSVLLSPDPTGAGLVAWAVPGLVLVAGSLLVWRWLRHDAGAGTAAEQPVGEAVAALAAWRDGALDPDDSPAGQALRGALAAAGTDADDADDADDVALARVATAYRRYTARPAAAAPPTAPRRTRPPLPRRAVTVGAAGVMLVVAGVGVALAVDRGGGAGGTGAEAAAASTAAAPSGGGAASPPAGWTGGMPQTPEDWVQLGHAYDADHQPAQAVAAYSMALQLQPDAESVLLLRADVLVRSGQAGRALPDLQQLDARHPDTPQVLLVLGLAQNATGAPEATATLRRFLELDPESPAAAGVRKLLDGG